MNAGGSASLAHVRKRSANPLVAPRPRRRNGVAATLRNHHARRIHDAEEHWQASDTRYGGLYVTLPLDTMGHDYITYEGDHELFHDFDLWTLRHFFVEQARAIEAAQPSTRTTEMRAFVERWDWLGPGVFTGTDLSAYIAQRRDRWELFLQLLQRSGDRIAGFGEFIPLDYLTSHVSTSTAYFTRAQPTRPYLTCIGRICTLLIKHEPQAT